MKTAPAPEAPQQTEDELRDETKKRLLELIETYWNDTWEGALSRISDPGERERSALTIKARIALRGREVRIYGMRIGIANRQTTALEDSRAAVTFESVLPAVRIDLDQPELALE